MIQSLKEVYLKNLNSLMTEISLYNSEEDIWKVEALGSTAFEFLICLWTCTVGPVKDPLSELSAAVFGDDTICTDTAGLGRLCREGKGTGFFGTAL